MGRGARREMTNEEFDAWVEASNKIDNVAETTDEAGGPRLSLVPVPDQNDAR